MSGGGGTTSSNTTSSIPPEVLAEYQNVTGQANQIASNPLQQYQGPVVAGLTPEENSAFNTIDNSQGTTAPYTASANNLIGQATQGINPDAVTSADIAQYQSPYTQQVLNTTMAAENNQDAQQQAQLQGNAISAGAWGGDRAGVAQGILGGQQAYANNATNAGILNQGYSQALSEANTQQQQNVAAQEATGQLDLSGGLAENQLGTSALSNTLAGANAQLSAGQLQQQQAQSELNVPYEQFLQQQAYPYQTTGWLANIAEGLGSNEGGTTTGTTTQPSQGLFRRGGGIAHRDDGGSVNEPSPQQGILSHIQQIPQRLRLQESARNANYGTGNQQAVLSGMARGGIVPKRASGGTTIGGLDFSNWIAANPGATYNGAGEVVTSNGSGMGGYWAPDWAQNFDASGNYINPNAPVAAKPSAPAFTAQTAPAAATSAAPSTSGVSYTGGTVKGINPAGQADLDAIYGKKARGGIVAPKHFDAGGGDITPDDVVQASTGYTLPDGTSDSMPHDYSGTSMPPLPSQNISSDSEGLPPPTPPVNAQGHPDAVSATSATVPNYEKDLPSDHQANPWLSVAAGVLGTLAGRSRNPLIDIGQGGLIGLNNYAQQSEVADNQNYKEGSFHQNAQKLAQEAQEHINDAKVKQENADSDMARGKETARHNLVDEQHAASALEQGKYIAVPPGSQIMNTKNGQMNNNMPGNTTNTSLTPLSGALDELGRDNSVLEGMSPKDAANIKAISDGRVTPTRGNGLTAYMSYVNQYDPNYTEQNAKNRQKIANDYAGNGQTGKSLLALNTIPEHLDSYYNNVAQLNNSSFTPYNSLVNSVKGKFSDPTIAKLTPDTDALAEELASYYNGTKPTDQQRKTFQDLLNPNQDAAGQVAQRQEINRLIKSRTDALATGYNAAWGDGAFQNKGLISPKTISMFEKNGIDASDMKPTKTSTTMARGTQNNQPAATQSAPAAAPAMPQMPSSVPPGSQWSPSRQQFRDASGKLYDKNGNPI